MALEVSEEWWEEASAYSNTAQTEAEELYEWISSEVAISDHPALVKAQATIRDLLNTMNPVVVWIQNSKNLGISEVPEGEMAHFQSQMRKIADFFAVGGHLDKNAVPVFTDGRFFNQRNQKILMDTKTSVGRELGKILYMTI